MGDFLRVILEHGNSILQLNEENLLKAVMILDKRLQNAPERLKQLLLQSLKSFSDELREDGMRYIVYSRRPTVIVPEGSGQGRFTSRDMILVWDGRNLVKTDLDVLLLGNLRAFNVTGDLEGIIEGTIEDYTSEEGNKMISYGERIGIINIDGADYSLAVDGTGELYSWLSKKKRRLFVIFEDGSYLLRTSHLVSLLYELPTHDNLWPVKSRAKFLNELVKESDEQAAVTYVPLNTKDTAEKILEWVIIPRLEILEEDEKTLMLNEIKKLKRINTELYDILARKLIKMRLIDNAAVGGK